jgi:hypothetical protein
VRGKDVARSAMRTVALIQSILAIAALLFPLPVGAIPVFARQTGQNCLACHAGGQFPELTPYGRLFKLTGYTIGSRTIPVAVMGVMSLAKVRNTSKSDDPTVDFQKNRSLMFATSSVFLGGKVTENIGAFIQSTYDNYAAQSVGPDGGLGSFQGHNQADNMDLRYADRFVNAKHDLIVGASINNNPSVSDPWNTAAAWMQYVPVASPTGHQFVDGPYPALGAGGNVAGATAYAYWNRTLYGELGLYRTADGALSIMSAGVADADKTRLGGTNPYWRLAYTREWGAHNLMVGASGMVAHIFDPASDVSDPNNRGKIKNAGFDAQYQYLLDPHTLTAQFSYMHQVQDYSANTLAGGAPPYVLADGMTPIAPVDASDTIKTMRAKLTYVYQAKYGGSISVFNVSGTSNTLNQTSGYDTTGLITSTDPNGTGITSTRVTGNLTGNPGTRGYVIEGFWTPLQYVRIGVQYTGYTRFNGASDNYDGFGRNAGDNNTLRLYVWGAY